MLYKAISNLASQDLSVHHLPLPFLVPLQSHGCLTFLWTPKSNPALELLHWLFLGQEFHSSHL